MRPRRVRASRRGGVKLRVTYPTRNEESEILDRMLGYFEDPVKTAETFLTAGENLFELGERMRTDAD